MRIATSPDIPLARRVDHLDPIDDRKLRRHLAAQTWVRIVAGVYAPGERWRALSPIEQHRLRVYETSRRLAPGAVIAFASAAALWDIDLFGTWPDTVDVIVGRSSGGRSGGGVRRHAIGLEACETTGWGRHCVTTPAQTALDLARTGATSIHGVAPVDQARWERRAGGALTTLEELHALHARSPQRRGDAKVSRALELSTSLADNPRETQSRLVIAHLGFPTPRLQERRVLRSGRLVYGDFFFPDHDHWAEVDGRAKYTDERVLAGRTSAQAVIDEKNRENEIRREVRAFSRWEPTDADTPRTIWDILTLAGLPTSRPRP